MDSVYHKMIDYFLDIKLLNHYDDFGFYLSDINSKDLDKIIAKIKSFSQSVRIQPIKVNDDFFNLKVNFNK